MFALITGASSGIGKEIAKSLAKRKYNLILTARREDKLRELKKQIEDNYRVRVVVKAFDLSSQENCVELFQQCNHYNIEIFVNNAGFGKLGRITSIPLRDETDMIHTNIIALHTLTKLYIQNRKQGLILNVASMAGCQPEPMMATYGATKSYVLNFTRAINYEMKKYRRRIHICTLCPGPVDTEFNRTANVKFNLRSISAEQCAEAAVNGLLQKKELIIPGADMKFLYLLSKVVPTKWILPIQYWIQMSKTRKLY